MILLILVLIAVLVAIKLFRSKRQSNSNRYRSYSIKTSDDSTGRVRTNRYHRRTQREPTLGYQHAPGIDEVNVEKSSRKKRLSPDDPDIVLGLKVMPQEDEPQAPKEKSMPQKSKPSASPIITFYLMASTDQPYTGYELLQAILSVGMRYGAHQIFHHHEDKMGRGSILFSLASAEKPGTFDLQNMGGFSTPALSLFFRTDEVDDPKSVYELMLQVAGQLLEDLGGRVYDENRELLTPSKVIAQRKKLRSLAYSAAED